MNNVKAIILDFDGVLVESVGIKDQAFQTLFSPYPEHLAEIMEYHYSHNATIRFDKFQFIFEQILHQEYTDAIKDQLSRQFSDLVVQNIIDCPSVEGAVEFLEYFYGKVPLFLASINPSQELEKILKARVIYSYFRRIYAHPWDKKEAMEDILKKEMLQACEVVFVGDSPEDYRAAAAIHVPFVGRSSNKIFDGYDVPLFKNFYEISKFLCH